MSEIVYVGGHRTSPEVYHTDKNCPRFPDSFRESTKARESDRRECEICRTGQVSINTDKTGVTPLRTLIERGQIDEKFLG